MPEARLNITIPEGVWVGDLSTNYPTARFRILAALANGQDGVGLAEIHSEQVGEILDDMQEYGDVNKINVLDQQDEQALVQFETTAPLLLIAAQDSGVPLEMPFKLVDGDVAWEITASSDRLSELGTQLRALGLPFQIDYIQQEIHDDQLLTDAQETLIENAITEGYYETPRECTLTELAANVDRAKSTISETLHRAEGKIIKQYAGRGLTTADETPPVMK